MRQRHATVPVVMPMWRRLGRLPDLVRDLNAQIYQNFTLVLWLNGADSLRITMVNQTLEQLGVPHQLFSTPDNLGGWARYLAFQRAFPDPTEAPPFAIMIDDDVTLPNHFISWARTRMDELAIWGRHGFRFNSPSGSYWNRTGCDDHVDSPDAHMVSTQSAVLDARVLLGQEIVNVDPKLVFGMEDIWLCYVATVFYGYKIRACRSPAGVVPDGKDVWPTIREKKNVLLTELRGRGWKV